jgi:regulator of sirC expression with transglutaminase-like and TPR domain
MGIMNTHNSNLKRSCRNPCAYPWIAAALILLSFSCSAVDLDAGIRAAWDADDPMAQLAREVRAKPQAFTYTDLSLRLAKEIYPGIEKDGGPRFRKELDDLVERLQAPLAKAEGARAKAEVIAKVLYGELELRTATDEKPGEEQAGNYFPNVVLEKKRGVCLGFSLLYLCLGERLKLPLAPAHAPQHIYVKWIGENEGISIETTSAGRVYDNERFVERFKLTDAQARESGYFEPLGPLEVLGDLFNAVSWFSAINTAEHRITPARALLTAQLCVAIEPRNYNNWDTLAEAYAYAGDHAAALAALRKTVSMKPAQAPHGDEFWKERLAQFEKAAGVK